MPIVLQCDTFPLSLEEVRRLWAETRAHQDFLDEQVSVRCVSEDEIRRLNKEYRDRDAPTNVLTFSYGDVGEATELPEGAEHDVALCLSVAEREAAQRSVELRDYVALLLVHALLHVAGMDHERSAAEERASRAAEQVILEQSGFMSQSL